MLFSLISRKFKTLTLPLTLTLTLKIIYSSKQFLYFLQVELPPLPMAVAYGSMLIAHSKITEAFSAFSNAISRGRILQPSDLTETHQVELIFDNIKYRSNFFSTLV